MRISTAAFPVLFALLASSTLLAQSRGDIHGSILSEAGGPVASAAISLKGTSYRTLSGSDGSFHLHGVAPGRYTLVAGHIGFATTEREVVLTAGESLRLDFTLIEVGLQGGGVTVTGTRDGLRTPASIGKTSIAPMDLPQSVAVINREILEQQQVLQLGDALKNVNGMYVMSKTGGTQEELAGRGFSLGSSSTFKNGVRFNNSVMPEMSALERLEVLKGSSAILFGNVSAGGVINLVTRKPKFESGGEISMRAGSFGLYKPSVDLYGPLLGGHDAAYRLNATYESAGSFRDIAPAERLYINPSIAVNPGTSTTVLVEGDYMKDRRTSDYGTGAINYAIADVPRDRFLGASWSYFSAVQNSLTATVSHLLDDNWKLQGVGGYQSSESDLFGTTRPNAGTMVQADGKWIRGVQRTRVDETYRLGQIDLTGELTTGPVAHSLLVGADVDNYLTKTTAYANIARYDSINIFDLDAFQQRKDIPDLKERTVTEAPVTRAGVYLQDLIGIGEHFKLLAGVRWSYQESRSNVLTVANDSMARNASFDDAITPRLGIVYQPVGSVSIFASYANSFTLNSGININGKPLPPSFLDQYEAGVKTDLFDGAISTNVTAYQIVNSDLAQASLENPLARELAGEVTSRGIELDVTGRPLPGLSMVAGYSYNRTTYTRSNIYEVGSLLRYNPAHTANASVNYAFLPGSALENLELGASVLYIGERAGGRSTRRTVENDAYRLIEVEGFSQVDLSAGYDFEGLMLRARVSNLFDTLSYYLHDDNSINPINPRTFTLSLRLPI